MGATWAVSLSAAWLAAAALAAGQARVAPDVTEPHPDLTPEQVISIQLRALKNNDEPEPDYGIKITFNFASPGNRRSTGPLDRFIVMVKNPLYRPMLNYRTDTREPIQVAGRNARQKITLIGAEGERASYLFVLSRQRDAPYKNCWMTDSVVRLDDKLTPSRVARAGRGRAPRPPPARPA